MLLNGICPYFTMFPLKFPHALLGRHGKKGEAVLDPFAGRGTTLYASRLLGMTAYGVDANPVAAAISAAKLANTTPGRVVAAARLILEQRPEAADVPGGEFWELAFHEEVLGQLCRLREGLLENCRSDTRKALRAVLLGGLHGPRMKGKPSYFSNQCPRTVRAETGLFGEILEGTEHVAAGGGRVGFDNATGAAVFWRGGDGWQGRGC